jgi:phytoene synthase
MSTQENFDYCSNLVRRRDEDRWIAAHYAPPSERAALAALYALHFEIERVPSLVSEAPLGEIRLQWWREALDEIGEGRPRAHPAVQAAHALEIADARARQAFNEAIDARARLFYGEPFASVEDLAAFLLRADAFVAPIAARRLTANLSHADEYAVEEAALANALARYGRALAPALVGDIFARAEELHRRAAPVLRAMPANAMPAFAHFSLTRTYLRRDRGPSPIGRRLRVFAAVASGRI